MPRYASILGEKQQKTKRGADGKTAAGADPGLHDSSYLEAAEQIAVTPNVSGKVSKINVEIGQRWQKGTYYRPWTARMWHCR